MISRTHKELLERGLLTQAQHDQVEEIASRRIVSVFYDLRMLLYAGVLLFSTGVGILIYKNIGEVGHLVAIGTLILLTAGCFIFAFRKGPAWSKDLVESPIPYFDYVLLLGCLLFISVQGYLQFRFDLLTDNLGISTLISSVLFIYAAYRFDHLGVLSLGITALASFFSITISPKKWYSGDFFDGPHVYLTAVIFGVALAGMALALDRKSIKPHFTFTYLNFTLLIYFIAALSGIMDNEEMDVLYIPLIYLGVAFAYFTARRRKSFLFLLYAFIAGYIATTYLLAQTSFMREVLPLWYYYAIISCGGFVYFIVKYRNFFSRKP